MVDKCKFSINRNTDSILSLKNAFNTILNDNKPTKCVRIPKWKKMATKQ